ncbi:MAG TPA: methyltransferase [Cyclobacteriaceae bacterium]|nr:methyltransferase [Cyclobacteriaceae bacterium]
MAKKIKDIFQFKKFSVKHDRCTHKVGTDGVLLGAWADTQNVTRVLDVGTGSGVIALMLAQRTLPDVSIDAIDISIKDCEQATENINASPWPEKVRIINQAIQTYESEPYDLIVTNPPYFIDSTKPPAEERTRARHTETLSPYELLLHAKRLLSPYGKFCIILPNVEAQSLVSLALKQGWYCTRLCEFRARINKTTERVLFQLQQQKQETVKESLILYEQDEEWTVAYKNLTRDFYVKI